MYTLPVVKDICNNFTCLACYEYAILRQFELICNLQAELLKILGENHVLYNFVGTLTMRCSYLLVNKEYAKEILAEASAQKTSGNTKLISSCMNLLTVKFSLESLFSFRATYSPLLCK